MSLHGPDDAPFYPLTRAEFMSKWGEEDAAAAKVLLDAGLPADLLDLIPLIRVQDLGSDDVLSQVAVEIDPRAVIILTGSEGVLWGALHVESADVTVIQWDDLAATIRLFFA